MHKKNKTIIVSTLIFTLGALLLSFGKTKFTPHTAQEQHPKNQLKATPILQPTSEKNEQDKHTPNTTAIAIAEPITELDVNTNHENNQLEPIKIRSIELIEHEQHLDYLGDRKITELDLSNKTEEEIFLFLEQKENSYRRLFESSITLAHFALTDTYCNQKHCTISVAVSDTNHSDELISELTTALAIKYGHAEVELNTLNNNGIATLNIRN